eukprot:90369_1
MSTTLWTDHYFRIAVSWINLFALLCILTYHSYRLCYLQRAREGSSLRLLKCISFRHLSFMVIISSILPTLLQSILYTPQLTLSNATCGFSIKFGMVCLAFSKLSLHLFVTMRSQVATTTTNIWYKLGVFLSISDLLWIIYIVSGIPTIKAEQTNVLCYATNVPLRIYIWFAMNDFVIGLYCLLAFVLPLRKYVWLEQQQKQQKSTDLRCITLRIMVYSSIALFSTMMFTVIASAVNESGGVMFAIDSTINALCVVFQFAGKEGDKEHVPCNCPSRTRVTSMSEMITPPMQTQSKMEMVIHPAPQLDEHKSISSAKPKLKGNKSLSVSMVGDNAMEI